MKEETIFIQDLLPSHYTCEPREMGVHCKSKIGFTEAEEPYWNVIVTAIKLKYQERFMEIYHQTCTRHCEFTVYLRPKKTVMELLFGHK